MRVVLWVAERMEKHASRAHKRIGVRVPALDKLPEITVLGSEKHVAVVGSLIVKVDKDFLGRDHYKSIRAVHERATTATT